MILHHGHNNLCGWTSPSSSSDDGAAIVRCHAGHPAGAEPPEHLLLIAEPMSPAAWWYVRGQGPQEGLTPVGDGRSGRDLLSDTSSCSLRLWGYSKQDLGNKDCCNRRTKASVSQRTKETWGKWDRPVGESVLDSNLERLGIKENAALRALASDHAQAHFHISSEQLPFSSDPLVHRCSATPDFVLNRMPFAFLCLEVFFAIKDRIIEWNYYRSFYILLIPPCSGSYI